MISLGRLRRAWSLGRALSFSDWIRVIHMTTRLARIEVGLRRHSLPIVAERFGAPLQIEGEDSPPEMGHGDLAPEEWADVVAAWRACKRWPFGDTCLRRALAIAPAVHQHEPRLRVGVARLDGEKLGAHAWLESETFSIGLDPEIEYSTLLAPAAR